MKSRIKCDNLKRSFLPHPFLKLSKYAEIKQLIVLLVEANKDGGREKHSKSVSIYTDKQLRVFMFQTRSRSVSKSQRKKKERKRFVPQLSFFYSLGFVKCLELVAKLGL
uniref:(northern house mosquito) hypothetical protein n=1 Tax=Culex pipiens TaxID=7175 RepID=A0A8D8CXC4_CULPI